MHQGIRAEPVPTSVLQTRPPRTTGHEGERELRAAPPTLRSVGNQTLQRLLSQRGIQPKLSLNVPGDEFEQEADRIADQVVRMTDPVQPRGPEPPAPITLQRKCAECEEEEAALQGVQRKCAECEKESEVAPIQRKCSACETEHQPHEMEDVGHAATSGIPADLESRIASVRTGGSPLPETVRRYFEPRLGQGLGGVRMHTDAAAAESARAVRARAYTIGGDIVFGAGEYAPDTQAGRALLAHELVHTLQQQRGRVERVARRELTTAYCGERAGGSAQEHPQVPTNRTPHPAALLRLGAPPPIQRACPPPPTSMGGRPVDPARDCSQRSDTVGGAVFYFCIDSDALTSEATALLPRYVPLLTRLSVVEVHGYASPEGPRGQEVPYNLNLSCLRANRLADELSRLGVARGKIQVFKHGGTTAYGAGHLSRVAIVPVPNVHRRRVAAYSLLACAPCNPFTDDGLIALTPPVSEAALSSFRMRHWIEAEVLSVDGLHIDPGGTRLVDAGRTPGISEYCGTSSTAFERSYMPPTGARLAPGAHGEGMEWTSEFVSLVSASVPCTLPDAPCGPLGPSPMVPPIRSQFALRIFADGTIESQFLGASGFPFHYLYEDGSLKESGGAPVSPVVDFDAWATSTGVPRWQAETGFKALREACCNHGRFPGCICKCAGGRSVIEASWYGADPGAELSACFGYGLGLAARSCPASCAPAGTSCSTLTRPANP